MDYGRITIKDNYLKEKQISEPTHRGIEIAFKQGGKLEQIKQFKQGGLINNLNKPQTWEEYQKLNRQK